MASNTMMNHHLSDTINFTKIVLTGVDCIASKSVLSYINIHIIFVSIITSVFINNSNFMFK